MAGTCFVTCCNQCNPDCFCNGFPLQVTGGRIIVNCVFHPFSPLPRLLFPSCERTQSEQSLCTIHIMISSSPLPRITPPPLKYKQPLLIFGRSVGPPQVFLYLGFLLCGCFFFEIFPYCVIDIVIWLKCHRICVFLLRQQFIGAI